jgi:peptidoglycan-N-acetylglucosamine deacetylase
MWPGEHRSAFAFTFDLDAEALWLDDDLVLNDAVLRSHGRYATQVAVPAILELLDGHDVAATFFVVGMVAEAYPHVISQILDAGHEVAAHGYTHRSPIDLSAKERGTELERVREVLTHVGAEVAGYRAPSWQLPPKGIVELDAQGFGYSSNLMDSVHPYRHPGTRVVELPIHWTLDDSPFLLFDPRDWSGEIRSNKVVSEIWRSEGAAIHEMGGATVLALHPQLIGRPGRLALLEEMLDFATGLDGAWIARCTDIAQQVSDLE